MTPSPYRGQTARCRMEFRPTSRWAAGDFFTLDFGAKKDGYCSDMTRTVAIGYADDRMHRVYDTVLRAQQAGACRDPCRDPLP